MVQNVMSGQDLRATSPEQIQAAMAELQRVKATHRDYIVPSQRLVARVEDGTGKVKAAFPLPKDTALAGTSVDFDIGKVAHEHLADKLQIPGNYYRRMEQTAPGLLVNNVNYWFNHNPTNLMLRTLDGRIRAVLSDRYRALDSFDLVFHAADVVQQIKQERGVEAVFQRLDLSEERVFFRLVLPSFATKITGRAEDLRRKGGAHAMVPGFGRDADGTIRVTDADDPNGDWVFPAIVGSNSEVGRGKLSVDLAMFRVVCSNYAIVGTSIHRVHLGERLEGGFELAADTREAKDKVVWLEVRDMIQAAFDPEKFQAMIASMNESQAAVLDDPIEAVDTVVKEYGLTDEDKANVLKELLSPSTGINPGITLWGLSNAVTMLAHSKPVVEGYQLEDIGGQLIQRGRELVRVRA